MRLICCALVLVWFVAAYRVAGYNIIRMVSVLTDGGQLMKYALPDEQKESFCESNRDVFSNEVMFRACRDAIELQPKNIGKHIQTVVMYLPIHKAMQSLLSERVYYDVDSYSEPYVLLQVLVDAQEEPRLLRKELVKHAAEMLNGAFGLSRRIYDVMLPDGVDEVVNDFNIELHNGMSFVDLLESSVAKEEDFAIFKSAPKVRAETGKLGLWDVFFSSWCNKPRVTEMMQTFIGGGVGGGGAGGACVDSDTAGTCAGDAAGTPMSTAHPFISDLAPLLFTLDAAIGAPEVIQTDEDMPDGKVIIGEPLWSDVQRLGANDLMGLPVSPVQLRYLLEAAALEEQFAPCASATAAATEYRSWLEGKEVLEIGGGYGGMAVSMQLLHPGIRKYSIVDLEAAGRLQQKYVGEAADMWRDVFITSLEEREKDGGEELWLQHRPWLKEAYPRLVTISSSSRQNVTSDLLLSMFAISELKRDVVQRYLDQYVAHAPAGFLQLNYDDKHVVGTKYEHSNLFPTIEMFRAVAVLHPSAVMLPPPGYHGHVRVVWDDNAVGAFVNRCGVSKF